MTMTIELTQQAYSVEPPSARQRNAIQMAFPKRADSSPLSDVYWESKVNGDLTEIRYMCTFIPILCILFMQLHLQFNMG